MDAQQDSHNLTKGMEKQELLHIDMKVIGLRNEQEEKIRKLQSSYDIHIRMLEMRRKRARKAMCFGSEGCSGQSVVMGR